MLSGCNAVSDASASGSPSFLQSDRVKGVVLIESPQMGSLLYLRGIAGKGTLTFIDSMSNTTNERQSKRQCVSAPIRFAAGDFSGSSIGIHSVESIRLLIYSDEIMDKLMSGDEVVSKDYLVTDPKENSHGDIKIESGLTLNYGFVLNPGEWSWSSLFGENQEQVDCGGLNLNSNVIRG
jgi:hypothetical protein